MVFTRDSETASVVAEIPTLQIADFGADMPEALEGLQAMVAFQLAACARRESLSPPRRGRKQGVTCE